MNIGVIGGSVCSKKGYRFAYNLGKLIAKENWVLICGGHSGIMEAACKGVRELGGISVGILPSFDGKDANPYLTVKIPTGLGYARNFLVVRASDVLVAIEGKYGTLSEMAFALNENKRVYGVYTWPIKGVIKVRSLDELINRIKKDVKL